MNHTYQVIDMERRSSVTERLGYVLYWVGCAAALLWLAFASFVASSLNDLHTIDFLTIVMPAALAFGVGKIARYVLAAR